jgi:ElaB/YqjD/DUF883 family membrane-anchored ribosome-binding protein
MIVEILDRRAGVRQRVRLAAFPATIGRGYQNDVILDDRYVDPVHGRLEWDGHGVLVLTDLGSTNGILDTVTGRRVAQLAVRSGTEARVGRTLLRFVDATHPVDPTLREAAEGTKRWIGDVPLRDLAVALGAGLLLGVNSFLDATERIQASGLLGEALTSLLVVAAWAGSWALVNRITQQRFRFPEHFVIPCAAIIAYTVTNAAAGYLRFLFPRPVNWELLSGIAAIGIAIVLLAAHLARVSQMTRRVRLAWSVGVVLGLAGIAILSSSGEHAEFGSRAEDTPLKPVGAAFIPAGAPADFFTRLDALQEEVDELSQKMTEREARDR